MIKYLLSFQLGKNRLQLLNHRKPGWFVLTLLILLTGCSSSNQSTETTAPVADQIAVLRQPAEYDAQEAVWLIWSPIDHLTGYSNEKVTLEIIDALVQKEKVIVSVANDTLFEQAKASIPDEYLQRGWVELVTIPSEEISDPGHGP